MMSSLPLDPLEVYKMNKTRRGLALVFNQQRFADENEFPYRDGSNVDCSNLKMSLKHLGFEVKAFTDLNKEQVNAKLDAAAESDHSDADCFLVVFMSHGKEDHVHASDDKLIIKEITDKFRGKNCRSLVGKPKIFIWQACRGEKNDDPVTPCAADEVVETRAVYTLPAGADFIMCYSVAEGYCSYWNSNEGSWYIQDLCELLQRRTGNPLNSHSY